MSEVYDITILGAGSAGLLAAATAVGMGAKVLLVERAKMGGDCLNYGCVPSKSFLKSAHLAKHIAKSKDYGIHVGDTSVEIKAVVKRVGDVIGEIAPHDSIERFTSMGVDVVIGAGEILGAKQVKVNEQIYATKRIIIATGSSAYIPPIKGIENISYYTKETIFDIQVLPQKLIVLGAGPIGLELGQGFCHLGTQVDIVDRGKRVFSKDEPAVAGVMEKVFEQDGIRFHLNSTISALRKEGTDIVATVSSAGKEFEITGDAMLICSGRVPNTKGLGLEKIGIATNERGFICVDEKLSTSVKHIYACGDVRGKFLFTHSAGYEASVAVKNSLIGSFFKTGYSNIAWTTYTLPEVAHVGLKKSEAVDSGVFGAEYSINIDENDRAKAENDRYGFASVIVDKKGRVVGATIVGEKAGEMLPVYSLMVTQKLKLSAAMSMVLPYPTQGEILKALSIQAFKSGVKEWQRNLIKKIIRSKK